MAYELTIRFIAQGAQSEDEARGELSLFLVNTPVPALADTAKCVIAGEVDPPAMV